MYDPYAHADELGIEVIHRKIRTANGFWYPDHRTIVLREGMRAVYDRSTLAHELAHAVLGHESSSNRNEVQADRLAAASLIDLEHCMETMKWAPDAHHLAAELRVTTRLVRVFLNVHRLAG